MYDESHIWDFDEPTAWTLPDGFCYRQLAQVDLDSPADLEAFAQSYGVMSLTECFPHDVVEGSNIAGEAQWLAQQLREGAAWPSELEFDGGEPPWERLQDEVPVREYAAVLGLLRDVSQVVVANRNPELLSEAALLDGWRSSELCDPKNLDDAVHFAVDVLNSGLRSFGVRVLARRGSDVYGEHLVTRLLPAACLQMANDISARASFSRCENATCGAFFVHRAGRANWKHRRSDAIYCSPQCTNQEMQRRRRALRVDVTRLMNEGLDAPQIAERLGESGRPLRISTVETLMREVQGRRKGAKS